MIYDNDAEDTFIGYKIDNIRKEYNDLSIAQLTVEFVKPEELTESDIIE